MSAATQAEFPIAGAPQPQARQWTALELRGLAAKAMRLKRPGTANFILSGTFGYFGEETVPVSDEAAAMLDALEAK